MGDLAVLDDDYTFDMIIKPKKGQETGEIKYVHS